MTLRFPIRSHMWFRKPRETRTTRTVVKLPTVTREECLACEWFQKWTVPKSEGRCTHKGLGCYRSPMRLDPWTKPVVCPVSSQAHHSARTERPA